MALLNAVFDVEMQNSEGINTQRANYYSEETAPVCVCVFASFGVYVWAFFHVHTHNKSNKVMFKVSSPSQNAAQMKEASAELVGGFHVMLG